jgi:DNA invertase Pin-like site-specific DNA recombinase
MKTEQQKTVTADHLQRNAVVYVRQAVMPHLADHPDSVERQNALRNRAIALAWPVRNIVLIDDDLGRAATAEHRVGFERLITEVGAGRVGIVLSLDAYRLARYQRDWQRLLDVCARTDTLIGFDDTLYDAQELQEFSS